MPAWPPPRSSFAPTALSLNVRQHQPLQGLDERVQIFKARLGHDVDHHRVMAVGTADELAGRPVDRTELDAALEALAGDLEKPVDHRAGAGQHEWALHELDAVGIDLLQVDPRLGQVRAPLA